MLESQVITEAPLEASTPLMENGKKHWYFQVTELQNLEASVQDLQTTLDVHIFTSESHRQSLVQLRVKGA